MKRNYFILFLSIFCYVSFAQKKMVVFKSDGTFMRVDVAKIDSIIFEDVFDESHAVDLGLSVKWCDVNLGAKSSEQYGDYFAWGETRAKASYEIGTYNFSQGDFKSLTKYNNFDSYGVVDGLTRLDSIDDAAHVQLQEKWRIPTKEEYEELVNNCTWEWTTKNGIDGYHVTGPNGNSIFIPVAGYLTYDWDNAVGKLGHYWSSSLSTNNDPNMAYFLTMDKNRAWMSQGDRYIGRSIRPVYANESEPFVPDVGKHSPMKFGLAEKKGGTRAAATASSYDYLGNTFNVYGCKIDGDSQNRVIDNYCVWFDGKESETTCNGWNYVGNKGDSFTNPASYPSRQTQLTQDQPVNYWKNNGSVYCFYAYSAPEGKASLATNGMTDEGSNVAALKFKDVTEKDNIFCANSRVVKNDADNFGGSITFDQYGTAGYKVLFNLSPINAYVRFGFYADFPGSDIEERIQFAKAKDGYFESNYSDAFSLSGQFVSKCDVSVNFDENNSSLNFGNSQIIQSKTFDNEPVGRLGKSLSDVTYIKPKEGYGPDANFFPILPRGVGSGDLELHVMLHGNVYVIKIPEEKAIFTSGKATTYIIKFTYTSLTLTTIVEDISFGKTDSVAL